MSKQKNLALAESEEDNQEEDREGKDPVRQAVRSVVHDSNNLFTTVFGDLQMLLKGLPEDDARSREYVQQIDIAVSSLAELLQKLHIISRDQVADRDLQHVRVNELLEMVKLLRHRELAVKVENLPDSYFPFVMGDLRKLMRVFLNLFVNAEEAGATVVRLNVTSVEEEGRQFIRINVEDNGTGVPEEDLEEIFKPGFSTKLEGGSGLGLYNCREIIEEQGGKIRASAGLQRGTTFILDFPTWAPNESGIVTNES